MTYPTSSYLKTMYLHNKSISKYSNINFDEIINQIQSIAYIIYNIRGYWKSWASSANKSQFGKINETPFFYIH